MPDPYMDKADKLTSRTDARLWQEGEIIHIDVRGLQPPQPMLEVLKLLDSADVRNIVIMHHDREPVYLYPELAERGWGHEIIQDNAEAILIRLFRDHE